MIINKIRNLVRRVTFFVFRVPSSTTQIQVRPFQARENSKRKFLPKFIHALPFLKITWKQSAEETIETILYPFGGSLS